MSYYVSYHHTLGDTSINCYAWEIAGILRNMVELALQGQEFSNVWRKFEIMLDKSSAEEMLDSLAQAMSADELDENLRFIAKGMDLEYDEL